MVSAVTLDPLLALGQPAITWPTTWTALTMSAENLGSGTVYDLVGDGSYPGGYYAQDSNFIYLRMRLATATPAAGDFSGAHFFLIDRVGVGPENGLPDFSFSWDSKSNDITKHGLEMQIYSSGTGTWNNVTMDDNDGDFATKATKDINGAGRKADGYLEVVTNQTGDTGWNPSTFLDVAVSWNYLLNSSATGLGPNQQWQIAFATISGATDHNALSSGGGDIGGGAAPASLVTTGWSGPITTDSSAVPEPGSLALLGLGSAAGLWWQRRRGKNAPPQTLSPES